MQPVIVMPIYDPSGLIFPHLKAITPHLKDIFAQAFVGVTAITREKQPQQVDWLETDGFFQTIYHYTDIPVGEEFRKLYQSAVSACHPDQILHLCFTDRVAFALQSDYSQAFTADIQAVGQKDTPLIFQRSETAWATHPRNYVVLEQMLTQVGRFLFNKEYDFGWCHLAVQARQLGRILPSTRNRDLSMIAEIVLLLKNEIQAKDVDWLAWEDPFIYDRDPQELKAEREQSTDEIRKRLGYVIPMLQLLETAAGKRN